MRTIIALVVVVFFASCSKSAEDLAALRVLNVGTELSVHDVLITQEGTIIAVGGSKLESGFFARSDDDGNSFTLTKSPFARSLYSIHQSDSTELWAGGDQLDLWHSLDGGKTWIFHWLADQVPYNGEDRPAVRAFAQTSADEIHFCGGENLGEGVVYESRNGGDSWSFVFYRNEFRGISASSHHLCVVGHGAILFSPDSLENLSRTGGDDEYFTALADEGKLWACTSTGRIFVSENYGLTWSKQADVKMMKGFGSGVLSDIAVAGNRIAAVGNEGLLLVSADGGQTWERFKVNGAPNFSCVKISNDRLFCGSDHGSLHLLEWPL